MNYIGNYLLCVLAASILWQGSFAKGQSGYICLIDDPKQNQCDSYCLTELSPRLSEVVKAQNQGNTNTRESDREIKSKLERLEVKIGQVQAKLPQVHSKLEGRLQGVEAKLEGQLQAVLNQLQALSNKVDAAKVASSMITIPSGFELIGNRYFRIVNEYTNWEIAERRCREMGGYLASFRNKEEFNAIKPKLRDVPYWIGINDHDKEGHFVSVASRKPAPFLKWAMGETSNRNHEDNCACLLDGRMWIYNCNNLEYFICQADNEI